MNELTVEQKQQQLKNGSLCLVFYFVLPVGNDDVVGAGAGAACERKRSSVAKRGQNVEEEGRWRRKGSNKATAAADAAGNEPQ